MSNLNHIIIPTVKNRPEHEQLNVFQSPSLCFTPEKELPLSKLLVDKKYHSAFKIYKQKKDKKQQNYEEAGMNMINEDVKKQKKLLKLKMRQISEPTINKYNQQLSTLSIKSCFYDPNEAPLFISNSQLPHQQHQQPIVIPTKTERIQEEIQVQLQQKIKNEPILEQELIVKYVQLNYQPDDPFIIIKKTNTKKDKISKIDTLKSKIIKKERKSIFGYTDQKKQMQNDKIMKSMEPIQPPKTYVFNKIIAPESFISSYDKIHSLAQKNDANTIPEVQRSQPIKRPYLVDHGISVKTVIPPSYLISRADLMI